MLPPEFAAILPQGAHAAWISPLDAGPPPFRQEAEALGPVDPRRFREFSNGRRAARLALTVAGAADAPLLIRADRSPAWPKGYAGSITHTEQAAMAVVARHDHLASIGIDLELLGSVEDELVESVCTTEEWQSLAAVADPKSADLATAVFCAKEAVYKFQSPLTGVFLEFHDVRVSLAEDMSFRATSTHADANAVVSRGEGRLARAAGHWLAVFWAR